eukprot:Skav235139  [mRNA]  locus=scaffold321:416835:420018:- [translate_table: standard]
MSYPTSNPALDAAVCTFIEELWGNGDPRGWAGDLLSGLGHLIPSVKGHLAGGWRLHAAWGRAELPLRALPFTPKLVYALAQSAFEHSWRDTGVLLVLGFYRYPRSGELFQARKADFIFDHRGHGVWSLPLRKSGQRIGARESLVLDDSWIGGLLRAYMAPLQAGDTLSRVSPATQRFRLKTLLQELQITGNFRWYSCRRGWVRDSKTAPRCSVGQPQFTNEWLIRVGPRLSRDVEAPQEIMRVSQYQNSQLLQRLDLLCEAMWSSMSSVVIYRYNEWLIVAVVDRSPNAALPVNRVAVSGMDNSGSELRELQPDTGGQPQAPRAKGVNVSLDG